MGFLLRFFPALEPYKYAIESAMLVALFSFAFAAGWHVKGNEDAATTLRAQQNAVEQANKLSAQDQARAEQHEAQRQAQTRQDVRLVEKVVVAAANYQTCRLKPEDLQLLNDAIIGGAK